MEPMDQFYAIAAGVLDPFGNQWWFGSRNEEVSNEELAKRMRESGDSNCRDRLAKRLAKWLTGRSAAAGY